MKIFFFDFTINFGGAPQGSLYLMYRLKKANYDVGIVDAYGIVENYQKKIKEYGLKNYVLCKNSKKTTVGFKNKPLRRYLSILQQSVSLLVILLNLYRLLKKTQPNVIIVNNKKSLFFIKILKSLFDYNIVLYFRGEGTNEQLTKSFIKSLKSKKINHVVAHSKKAIENLKLSGTPREKLSYIPNCIELDKFTPPTPNNDLPKKNKFRLILAAARPVKEKGHHIAIEAMHELKKLNIHVDLLIPGVVPTGINNSYLENLKSLIKSYGLSSDVHFIGWRDNLISDFVQCDAVLLPSHTEGFPRTIIEAMLHKIPVCATPVGGIPEAIKHRETGMIFEVDNVRQLVNNLVELITNKELRLSITENAQHFSQIHFHPKHNTEGMISILKNLTEPESL